MQNQTPKFAHLYLSKQNISSLLQKGTNFLIDSEQKQ